MQSKRHEPIRRILFPTDFSAPSMAAFEHAERLAADTNAELIALHVFGLPDYWGTGGSDSDLDKKSLAKLQELRPKIADVNMTHVTHGGQAGAVICWMAEKRECDLIVMGTHGRTGLANVIMGSVAGYVMRHARCPVLTVRMQAENEAPLPEPVALTPVPPIM